MNNTSCTTHHAIMFFLLLSLLLVYNHDFISSSKPTKPRPRSSSCSCNCPAAASPADPTIILCLAFLSGVLFTLLCILTVRFPALFTAPIRSAVFVALDISSSCVRRIKRIRTSPLPPPPIGRNHSPAAIGGGISASLLKTLPVFVYSTEKRPNFGKDAGLCAICLSEFLNEQTLRWLPDCDHLFHLRCIDTWLESNKTCPCCRANVERAGGDTILLDNGENSDAPEMVSSFRRLPDGDGERDLDDRRRTEFERSSVSGLIRVLMGRRRNQGNRTRHR